MRRISLFALFAIASGCWAAQAGAVAVNIEVTGTVAQNQIAMGDYGAWAVGDAVTLTFMVDSNAFVDDPMRPTRGYVIDAASWSISNGVTSVGLADPYPAVPYFVLRNDDPGVDGFAIGDSPGSPDGLATDEDALVQLFSATYENDPLDSLDILSAAGTYGLDGLSVFSFGVAFGPIQPMFIDFETLSIRAVPLPAAVWLMIAGLGTLLGFRRKA